jgi:hypothetical protein
LRLAAQQDADSDDGAQRGGGSARAGSGAEVRPGWLSHRRPSAFSTRSPLTPIVMQASAVCQPSSGEAASQLQAHGRQCAGRGWVPLPLAIAQFPCQHHIMGLHGACICNVAAAAS